jgi:hypothetical protein
LIKKIEWTWVNQASSRKKLCMSLDSINILSQRLFLVFFCEKIYIFKRKKNHDRHMELKYSKGTSLTTKGEIAFFYVWIK